LCSAISDSVAKKRFVVDQQPKPFVWTVDPDKIIAAAAQSVGRVARLSRNVRQPNHVLANSIAGHKTEWRPRAGEEWLAATKYGGV
jgi:hypothetical protein